MHAKVKGAPFGAFLLPQQHTKPAQCPALDQPAASARGGSIEKGILSTSRAQMCIEAGKENVITCLRGAQLGLP